MFVNVNSPVSLSLANCVPACLHAELTNRNMISLCTSQSPVDGGEWSDLHHLHQRSLSTHLSVIESQQRNVMSCPLSCSYVFTYLPRMGQYTMEGEIDDQLCTASKAFILDACKTASPQKDAIIDLQLMTCVTTQTNNLQNAMCQ